MINQKINSYIGSISDCADVQNFIKKNWKKKHILGKNKEFFKWLYFQNKRLNFSIVRKNNTIVGIMGFIPQKKFDSKLSDNQIALTLSVTSKQAPPGTLFRLFSTIKKNFSINFITSSGNWNSKLVDYNKLLGFKINAMDHFFILSKKKLKLINSKYKFKFNIKNIGKFKLIKKNTSEKKYRHLFVNKPKKSLNFLINRYLNHPIFNYEIYEIKNNYKILCLLVIRLIKVKNENIIKIVDYQGQKKNIVYCGALLNYLIQNYNPEFIDFVSNSFPKNLINKVGFKNKLKFPKLILPDYVNPWVLKNIEIKCGVIRDKKDEFLVMRGDGDRDSPN